MTAAPEYGELHQLVDLLTPAQVRALRAVALELVHTERDGVDAPTPPRRLSFAGVGHGTPDLAERSQDILWSELGGAAQ